MTLQRVNATLLIAQILPGKTWAKGVDNFPIWPFGESMRSEFVALEAGQDPPSGLFLS